MPFLSSTSSPFDEIIEKATHETNTAENWGLILDICDRVSQGGSKGASDALLSLKKRLNHRDPHVAILALSVLDSCMSNCGSTFRREVCSREFVSELRSKATGSNRTLAEKTRLKIKRWAEEECKNDSSLSLLPALYSDLKKDGYSFDPSDPPKRTQKLPTDPNVVSSKEEEEAIAKAIQASLKDAGKKGGGEASSGGTGEKSFSPAGSSSLYPSALSSAPSSGPPPPARTVKALYDFEAAEDNELTFRAGEIITVLDDSDINWWRGSNQRGEGLFPSSFVTADLTAAVEQIVVPEKKAVQFEEKVEVQEVERVTEEPPRIDEEKLDSCLSLLDDADPTGERPDPPELEQLERSCAGMGPLIDKELAESDRQHNLLADVDVRLREALGLYDSAMKEAASQLQMQLQAQQQASQLAAAAAAAQQQQQQYYSPVGAVGGLSSLPTNYAASGQPSSLPFTAPSGHQPQPGSIVAQQGVGVQGYQPVVQGGGLPAQPGPVSYVPYQ